LRLLLPASAACVLGWLMVPESVDPHGRHFDFHGQVWGALTLSGVAPAAIAGHDGLVCNNGDKAKIQGHKDRSPAG
jgi:hypothetical protein